MNQLKHDIKVISFRKIEPLKEENNYKRLNAEDVALIVVLVDIGGTVEEKRKMKECEEWMKKNELIRLMKINKVEAFQATYRLMMKQALPAYFILLLPIEKFASEPICNLYKTQLKNSKNLQQIEHMAKDNIQRIKFVIIQDQLQNLRQMSFLHSAIHLVTSQTIFIFDMIEQYLRSRGKLKIAQSTSSIGTSQIESFAKRKDEKIGQGVSSPQKKIQPTFDAMKQAWKMKNNTPGVGSYNITK